MDFDHFCSRIDRIQSNTYIHRISTPPPMNPENVVIPQVLDTFRIFDASAGEGSGRPFWGIITRVLLKSHRFQKMLQPQMIFNDFGFDGRFKSLPSRTVAILKIALPLGKYPHFRSSTDHFHQLFGCPLEGGLSGVGGRDRTPKSAQNWFHLGCKSDIFGGNFEEEDARQPHHKHRLMRTHDVHVYCDHVVADIATKLHH